MIFPNPVSTRAGEVKNQGETKYMKTGRVLSLITIIFMCLVLCACQSSSKSSESRKDKKSSSSSKDTDKPDNGKKDSQDDLSGLFDKTTDDDKAKADEPAEPDAGNEPQPITEDKASKRDERIDPFIGVNYYLSSDFGFEILGADKDGISRLKVWGMEKDVPEDYEYDLTPNGFQNWLGKIVLGCKDESYELTFYFNQDNKLCELIVKAADDVSGASHKGLKFLKTEVYGVVPATDPEPTAAVKKNEWTVEKMEPKIMIVSGSPAVKPEPSLESDKLKISFSTGDKVTVIGHVSKFNGTACDYYLIQGDTEMYVQGFFLKEINP